MQLRRADSEPHQGRTIREGVSILSRHSLQENRVDAIRVDTVFLACKEAAEDINCSVSQALGCDRIRLVASCGKG